MLPFGKYLPKSCGVLLSTAVFYQGLSTLPFFALYLVNHDGAVLKDPPPASLDQHSVPFMGLFCQCAECLLLFAEQGVNRLHPKGYSHKNIFIFIPFRVYFVRYLLYLHPNGYKYGIGSVC